MRNPIVQAVALIVVATVLALVSNALASRDRRLVLPGYYPNAMEVPKHEATPMTTSSVAPRALAPRPAAEAAAALQEQLKSKPETPAATSSGVAPRPLARRAPAAEAAAATQKPAADPLARFTPHPDKAYVEVDYDDARALQAAGALVLDARRTSVYEQGHITGARPFSVWESDIDDKVNKLYEERSDPREQLKPILAYCSGGDCEDSHMLAQKLWGVQFNNVYVYREGYPDWQKHGGPIHTGTTP